MQLNDGVETKHSVMYRKTNGTPTVHASRKLKQRQTVNQAKVSKNRLTHSHPQTPVYVDHVYAPYSLFGSKR